MEQIKKRAAGVCICALLAIPCWILGSLFPIVGGPVFAILLGMIITLFWKKKGACAEGIQFTSKKVLQYAVILLGFGLNLGQIAQVGSLSLPIICSTIATSLIVSYVLYRALSVPGNSAVLIGVGSSICGGSAIAATAPIVKASDQEVAQAISVVFLFNVIAALVFPTLGSWLGLSDQGFALFAGTAVNDTSSVTAAASSWDDMHPGADTLSQATIVKLTRTLAIIPITLVLALWTAHKEAKAAAAAGKEAEGGNAFSLKRAFPMFIFWFVVASVITTVASLAGVDASLFSPLKTLSKYFIVMAMMAIGLNTDLVGLVKSGAKPIVLGACCWVAIACVSLGMQLLLGIW